ncbi:hypothetical protein [Roseburia hominis]|uniref:hypothetical protein n=1 Tax=Roseburia hominis TaxID=301301 RepID=UPI001C0145ED|nr:hypothetical protein [Roseburia hominis]MBT9667641.1 hypothetical protein [Roseburia hominis]
MTENEAIEVLKDFGKQVSAKADGAYQSTIGKKACDVAIRSLKKVAREHKGMELTDYWWNAFRGSFETEDDVFDYIFDRVDTSDFEDSYIDAGGHGDCDELVKITASDKRNTMYDFMMAILDEVQKYRAIGTAEELQDMKSNYFEALSDWRQYRKIGTLEECRAAVEKQTAKKVMHNKKVNIYFCPICERKCNYMHSLYCSGCGQKLDWSDEE